MRRRQCPRPQLDSRWETDVRIVQGDSARSFSPGVPEGHAQVPVGARHGVHVADLTDLQCKAVLKGLSALESTSADVLHMVPDDVSAGEHEVRTQIELGPIKSPSAYVVGDHVQYIGGGRFEGT
eukprot:CAMPEP_0203849794 /NCGR_PEP_ID=MMETSP0359-20131031/6391_1 /ASSEMBLY_ACC=CAM_ASM_000338 /TAXON_ID=268821 /ORGANISM="Scrippsiella Hangoei, Strain SHTV-5" /LENGTH=123 /DNA_ID=CAMNT_0050765591 /DNA_START=245 /DNA_END=613 /DNA_ORIENTATION=+